MDDTKQIQDDHLVRLKMYTADYRVPSLFKFVEDNNPNDKKGLPPALLAVQLTDGSPHYVKWIKKQVHPDNEKDTKPDDDEKL